MRQLFLENNTITQQKKEKKRKANKSKANKAKQIKGKQIKAKQSKAKESICCCAGRRELMKFAFYEAGFADFALFCVEMKYIS